MVANTDIEHVFKFPVEKVIEMHLNKYPNPKEPRVTKVITMEERKNHTTQECYYRRVAFIQNVIPKALRQLTVMSIDSIELEEEGWIDPSQRTMRVSSKCLSFAQHADIKEESSFSPHESNPGWTNFKQRGSVEIKSLGYFGCIIEQFARRLIQNGAVQATQIMDSLLSEQEL